MRRRNRAVPNLKRARRGSSVYYYYKMPDGQLQALGKITPGEKTITDKEAVEATLALNASLRSPDSVLNRVLSITLQPERPNMILVTRR